MIRRIFAGSIVALLLSVSSLAAACDLSCAFASVNSDCHSQIAESRDPNSDGMKMGGMDMSGMTMPEMGNGGYLHAVAGVSRANASHPSIGDMGPCERQSCGNSTADSAKTSRSTDSHSYSPFAIAETPRTDLGPPLLPDARDDIGTFHFRDGSLLQLNLRI